MKKIIAFGIINLILTLGMAQSDVNNQKKYWNFRNRFKQNFIRIGPSDGESLPMGRRGFGKCQDTDCLLYGEGGGNGYCTDSYGTLYWGDGVIRHGHYIGFLATEYRLLKNQDKDVTAVLNELYYALQAFNRLDYNAEIVISNERYNISSLSVGLYNGYYLRDDMPKDFCLYWENEPIKARGQHGLYDNNNTAHLDDIDNSNGGDYNAEIGHYFGWNEPSLDQMSSILVGLKVCHVLLDDGLWIQPTPNDSIMGLKEEVIQITHRIVDYAYQHNWYLLDSYGWPTANGGGDLAMTAYPISLIGNQITGLNYNSTIIRRASQKFNLARDYYELETQVEKDIMWDSLNPFEKIKIDNFLDYPDSWPNGPSRFELWQNQGTVNPNINIASLFWSENLIFWPAIYTDWLDDHKVSFFPEPFNLISWDKPNFQDYNNTILMNLGVASGNFNKTTTKAWEDGTHHHQLALIQALLNDDTPVNNKQFYQDILNSMPGFGSFKFSENDNWQNPIVSQIVYPLEWGGEYRWTHNEESTESIKGNSGQYTALDYMYLHNLYYLVFGENMPDYKEDYSCICEVESNVLVKEFIYDESPGYYYIEPGLLYTEYVDSVIIDANVNHNGFLPSIENQLDNLESCVPNALSDIGPTLSSQYNLGQLHDNYADMKIYLNSYQTDFFTVQSGGQLDIESRMIVCENQILHIQNGGAVNLIDGEIRVNANATLIIEGNLFINENKKLILEDSSKVIIMPGGTLHNQGYIEVNSEAVIEYHSGAELVMDKSDAEINFDGGDLLLKQNAQFTFTHQNGPSGKLRFSKSGPNIYGEANTQISLNGDGANDVLIEIENDADFWNNSQNYLNLIVLQNGKAVLKENSRFIHFQRLTSSNFNYESTDLNSSLYTLNKTTISSAVVDNVKLIAYHAYYDDASLTLLNSTFNYSNLNQNDNLIEVTGKHYKMINTTLNTDVLYALSSENLTQTSYITNCEINYTGNSSVTTGVRDVSNAEIQIKNTNFNDLNNCVVKSNGRLTLKCNNFNNFFYSGITASSNCNLSMIVGNNAGYNTFSKANPNAGYNIYLNNAAYLFINSGYNHFDNSGQTPIIAGSVQIGYPNVASQSILANKNQWGQNANNVPGANRISLISSISNHPIQLQMSNPQTGNCGEFDGPSSGNPIAGGSNATSMMISQNFNHVKMGVAIKSTIDEAELMDNLKDDLIALELFKEILTYDYNNMNKQTKWYYAYATEYMKQTLQHTFESGKICREDNNSCFHSGVQNYVDVLNVATAGNVTNSNYRQMFNLEMDKVHLFHMLGNNDLALDLIYNLENCGLDYKEQDHLNHWKYQLELEKVKIEYGPEAIFIDTTWIDTSNYFQPVHQSFGNFGSEITSFNSVSYFDCSVSRSNISDETELQFTVYPNPSHGLFNVEYNLPEESTGIIIIYSTDGKEIFRTACYNGNQYQRIDITNIERGIYIYSYVVDGIESVRGKVVIQ